VSSSNTSFLQPEDTPDVSPNYLQEMTTLPKFGNFPLSVILENSQNDKAGKILLTATHHMLMDNFLNQAQTNVIFLSNMIEYASWGDLLIGVRSRGKTLRPLIPTTQNIKNIIKWFHMLGMPLLAIMLGFIAIWAQQKKRARRVAAVLGAP